MSQRRRGAVTAMAGLNSQLAAPAKDHFSAEMEYLLSNISPEARAEITAFGNGLAYKKFVMTPTGLKMPEGTQEPEWRDIGKVIRQIDSSISWIIGDWAKFANTHWRMTAKQIAEEFEYEQSTIETYISVCTAIDGLIRNQTVSFSHHRLLTKISDDQKTYWLNEAAANKWTVGQLRNAMQGRLGMLPPPFVVSDKTRHLIAGLLRLSTEAIQTLSPEQRQKAIDETYQMERTAQEIRARLSD